MGGLFGSVKMEGNRITDFASQTASVGIPIPFGFGKFPCEGNVIFAPMPPKEHATRKKQGKGGVKTTEYTYTLSYAIAFCEGPIFGYWSIRRNGKVVWTQDPNAPLEDKQFAAKWAQKATFYYGTETQLPDSTIESYKGIGKVSAHRGLAYIVVEDDDVTDGGGAVPTYEAVIIASPPDIYVTSKPYALIEQDSIGFKLSPLGGELRHIMKTQNPLDYIGFALEPVGGEMRSILRDTSNSDQATFQLEPIGGSSRKLLLDAFAGPDSATFALSATGGNSKRLLIEQTVSEKTTFTLSPTGGKSYE